MLRKGNTVVAYNNVQSYLIPDVPDPAYSQYQTAAGGDVIAAVADGSEHFLRSLAHMPPESCFARLLFIYEPPKKSQHRQNRLKLYLQLKASDKLMTKALDRLICGGLLGRFYEFKRIRNRIDDNIKFKAICEIIRREDFIRPLYTCEFNYKIPDCYYTIDSFKPNRDNDYLTLDRVLDRVDEPVKITIDVNPVDISCVLHAHTAYLAQLGTINHSWDNDEGIFKNTDSSGGRKYNSLITQLKPLNYKDPLANDILQNQRQFHKTLIQPHLQFSIRVEAGTKAVARLVSSILAECAFEQGTYRIISIENTNKSKKVRALSQDNGRDNFDLENYSKLRPLSRMATIEELSGVFRLPVASYSSCMCCRKNTDPPVISENELMVLGHNQQSLDGDGMAVARGVHIDVMKKHLSCFGLPGYGKTTNNLNILYQLHSRGIPFLVIECAKKEYRAMKMLRKHKNANVRSLAEKLEVYTPGAENVSPFRLNPFEIPPGIEIAEHIEMMKADFKGSIPVSSGSLPALLAEALEKVYQDRSFKENPPVMKDLIDAVQAVFDAKGYSDQVRSDMQTAIEVRLGILTKGLIGRIFESCHGITMEHLMAVPAIIELDMLPADQACLMVLSILSRICEQLKAEPVSDKSLNYVVLIEEAHVVFGSNNNTVASEEIADTKSFVSDLLTKMLVTLRALKVGIILSDQHPTALEVAASKSVASKLAFRQVHSEDRDDLGMSMLLKPYQVQDLARLRPGEGFFFTEGYFEPQRIITPNLGSELSLFPPPTDRQLRDNICNDRWFTHARQMRIGDILERYNSCINNFDEFKKDVTSKVAELLKVHSNKASSKNTAEKVKTLTAIINTLILLKKKLKLSYNKNIKDNKGKIEGLIRQLDDNDICMIDFAESLKRRFISVELNTQKVQVIIEKNIENYKKKLKGINHGQKKN